MQHGSSDHQESLTTVLLDIELELEQITVAEERLREQLHDVAQRRVETEITAKHLRGRLESLHVAGDAEELTPQQPTRRIGLPLLSPSGQTRLELALHLLATSDRPITSRVLAQVFDNTDKPKRNRTESARQTLVKLVDAGKAQRLDDGSYVASREGGLPELT
jgi:hypothetical protein